MGRIKSFLGWTVGAAGGVLTLAAQTKPEDAISNLGAWAGRIGLRDLPLPANIDMWATIIGILMMVLAVGFWWRGRRNKAGESAPENREVSPIDVADRLHVDVDPVKNERGDKFERCYSVAVCLWVTNGLNHGAVLRNLQARYYHLSGQYTVLPIRGAEQGVVDLRHGEVAVIEIGRMLWHLPEDDNSIPGMPRPGLPHQIVEQAQIDNCGPTATHRSFMISNAFGKTQGGIGQLNDDYRFGALQIVISADDVISRYVRMQTNLYAKDAHDWLHFLPTEEEDDPEPE